jgi:hypothetical protein
MKNPLLVKLFWVEVSQKGQKMTILWESDLKTTHLEQLSPTFAQYLFFEGAFSAGS